MIKHLIKNIRRKPKVARDNIALGIAGGFTALVAIIWIYHLPTWYSAIEEKHSGKEASGFSDLFGDFKDQFANAKESKSEPVSDQVGSTTAVIKVELDGENVPVENWALLKADVVDVGSLATTSASSTEVGVSSSSTTTTTKTDYRPFTIATTTSTNGTTSTTSATGR